MGRRQLNTNARFSSGNNRVGESNHIDSFIQQLLGEFADLGSRQARGIHAADDGADRGAGDHRGADAELVERFEDVLPTSWLEVQGSDDEIVANPVMDHQPYLPASFLVQVPFVTAADVIGITWDPRVLGWLALVAVAVALAVRAGPAWARAGAVLCVGSAFTLVYLAWGTNDSLAMCAVGRRGDR